MIIDGSDSVLSGIKGIKYSWKCRTKSGILPECDALESGG